MATARGLQNSSVNAYTYTNSSTFNICPSISNLRFHSICLSICPQSANTARTRNMPKSFPQKQTASAPPTGEGGVKEGQGLLPSYGRGVRWTRYAPVCGARAGLGGPSSLNGTAPLKQIQTTPNAAGNSTSASQPSYIGEVTGLMPHPESLVDSAYGSTMKAATGKAVPADWRLVTQGWAGVPLT